MNKSVNTYMADKEMIEKMRKLGADPVGGSPDDMQSYVLSETEKWGKVAKFAGIKPE